jgi:hypothetical protein
VDYEFPLGFPKGITADPQGRIYVGLQFYRRVQQYDRDGNFLTGWSIPTSGEFRIRTNSSGELEVIAARGDELFRYTPTGELLWRRSYGTQTMYEEFGEAGETRFQAADGNVLLIERSVLLPRIVRIFPTGERERLLHMPWYKWVLMCPLPGWSWGFLGAFIVSAGKRLGNA